MKKKERNAMLFIVLLAFVMGGTIGFFGGTDFQKNKYSEAKDKTYKEFQEKCLKMLNKRL